VTGATGSNHMEMYKYTGPLMEKYANKHNYEFSFTDISQYGNDRPASWYKILINKYYLSQQYTVLWIDVDIVILDGDTDILSEIPNNKIQSIVPHYTSDGTVPNMGLWLLKPDMYEYMDKIWEQRDLIHHRWWEQAATLRLMGYADGPSRHVKETELHNHTHYLSSAWNWCYADTKKITNPKFIHCTFPTMKQRLETIILYSQKSNLN